MGHVEEEIVNKPQPHTDDEVRSAIDTLIAHMEHYWGFCEDKDYTFGCASCEANRLRASLQSIADFLGE